MKKADFKDGKPVKKEVKKEGKKLDPYKVLKETYDKPQRVASVGGKGYV